MSPEGQRKDKAALWEALSVEAFTSPQPALQDGQVRRKLGAE